MDERLLAKTKILLSKGPSSETDLARALYGVSGSVAPWLPILRRTLEGSPDFARGDDGTWSLRGVAQSAGRLAVAGRRTRARGGRLVALALAPIENPHRVWRWTFETGNQTPRYLNESVRLDEEARKEWVAFADVAADIANVLGDHELVALDPGVFQLLAVEFRLCGMAAPANPVRTCRSDLLHSSGRKLSLARMRERAGLPPNAPDDLTSELELIGALAASDETGGSESGTIAEQSRHRAGLYSAVADFPESPGVYTFRDAHGDVLYVGSAANLRRRVMSYFGGQIEITREMHGLLDRTAHVEYVRSGTHPEAVVHEARIIADLQPAYNVQRRLFSAVVWLRIGAEPPVNVVQVATSPREDSAAYLGPFFNRALVADIADVICALWGFRRRGGSAKSCEESALRRDGMVSLLRSGPDFYSEARRRYLKINGSLSLTRSAELGCRIDRIERVIERGELRFGALEAKRLIVARADHESRTMFLTLVQSSVCVACARVPQEDESALNRIVEGWMSDVQNPGTSVDALESTVVGRWLYAHRDDPMVVSVEGDAATVVERLLTAAELASSTESVLSGVTLPDKCNIS